MEDEFVKLVYRGAEADIFSDEWAGEQAIFKFRKPLPYRHPELDAEIRAQRTIHEAEILHDAKSAGVSTPSLYYVSQRESLIVMQEIQGERLKSFLESARGDRTRVSTEFGAAVGRLHLGGIMHGDLTTSNVLVDGATGVRLIDFGLATHSIKVEDHAVDLRLIKETLIGAHSEIASRVMSSFMKGYTGEVGEARARAVGRKLLEIERRGRYARLE
jgi:TP53 regulating kinase and related kinases